MPAKKITQETPEWKRLPLIDQDLVNFLRKKFPPLEWERGVDNSTFVNDAIFRAGCIETVNALETIMNLQRRANK